MTKNDTTLLYSNSPNVGFHKQFNSESPNRLYFAFKYKPKILKETLVSTLTKVEVAAINFELSLDTLATVETQRRPIFCRYSVPARLQRDC